MQIQSHSHIPRRWYDKGSERAAADSDPISVLAEKATSDMFGIPQILQRAQVPMLESKKYVWSEFWVCLVNGLMVTNPPPISIIRTKVEIAQPRDKKATFLKLRNVQDLLLFVPLQLQAMMIIDHNDNDEEAEERNLFNCAISKT